MKKIKEILQLIINHIKTMVYNLRYHQFKNENAIMDEKELNTAQKIANNPRRKRKHELMSKWSLTGDLFSGS